MVRRSSAFNTARIGTHLLGDVELVFGDLSDGSVAQPAMRNDSAGRRSTTLELQVTLRVSFT